MEDLINILSEDIKYEGYNLNGDELLLNVSSVRDQSDCPYCGQSSQKIHSRKIRTLKDLPIQGKKVKLLLTHNKYFCRNEKCPKKHLRNASAFMNQKQR